MARDNFSNFDFDLNGKSPQQIAGGALLIFGLVVIAYVVWSAAYVVDAHEQAVVLRFGKYHTTAPPGLRFKLPGIDQRVLVDMSEKSMKLPWGYNERSNTDFPSEGSRSDDRSLILTGDLYAAVVEWNVFWRVTEPEKFIFSFNEQHVNRVLLAVARSTMHRIVGDYSADETLTVKREEIALQALSEMKDALVLYDAGIEITNLQLQRVTPPDSVKPSFDAVNASIQEKGQLVYEATRERNSILPMARAQADKLVREAEGYSSRRLSEAQGEISALLAKYESYKLAPEITRQRMYLETMERVFATAGRKLILDEQLKGLVPLMQIGQPAANQ